MIKKHFLNSTHWESILKQLSLISYMNINFCLLGENGLYFYHLIFLSVLKSLFKSQTLQILLTFKFYQITLATETSLK